MYLFTIVVLDFRTDPTQRGMFLFRTDPTQRGMFLFRTDPTQSGMFLLVTYNRFTRYYTR